MENKDDYDLVVLGAGNAGLAAAAVVRGAGRRVLASSHSTGPLELFSIDLITGAEVGVSDRALLAAALSSRLDGAIAYAFPDAAGAAGWELVLLTPQGAFAKGLDQGPAHALLPTWQPDGGDLVYLGQVGATP